ncbi:hypothetical protein [Aeoliella sp. SH292]|uniref:hypothetical protein n=1 Tax=Aeoliella sp. SH292 TaxID=3454464 RepID=UPI003F9B0050
MSMPLFFRRLCHAPVLWAAITFATCAYGAEGEIDLPVGFYGLQSSEPYNFGVATQLFSDSGSVVAGRFGSPFTGWMYLWQPGVGVSTYATPVGYENLSIRAISKDGSVVGGTINRSSVTDRATQIVRWDAAHGFEFLGRLSQSFGDASSLRDLNYDGSVFTGYGETPNGTHALRWSRDTGLADLGTLGTSNPFYDPSSSGDAVSADGTVIAGSTTRSGSSYSAAAIWSISGGWYVPNQLPGTLAASFFDVNSDGTMAVGYAQVGGEFKGIIYDQDGLRTLPELDEYVSLNALTMSDNAEIIGGFGLRNYNTNTTSDYFLWVRRGNSYEIQFLEELLAARGIEYSGWRDLRLNWVSPDGRKIGGSALNSSGYRRPFIAVIEVPEPVALAQVAVLGSCLALCFANCRGKLVLRLDTRF